MSAPPIPPRPFEPPQHRTPYSPPPVPPLPPDLRRSAYEDSLAAPRPHRIANPSIPANMSRIAATEPNYNPGGFAMPTPMQPPPFQQPPPVSLVQSPPPMHQGNQQWAPWAPPVDQMASLSFNAPHQHPPHPQHRSSTFGPPPKPPSPPKSDGPSLTAVIPTVASLQAVAQPIQQPNYDPASKIAWARDVLFLVNRAQQNGSTDPPVGPVTITDQNLLKLAHIAVPIILDIASRGQQPPMAPHVAEAVYLRATLAASGAFPDLLRQNLRSAFRDFETAARGGYATAWFRLGRDYESFNDHARAKDCFERGVKLGVESCCYRMGMAHLMGQLGLPASQEQALPLLHRAATLASLECPQPAYVYSLLLLNEFTQVSIQPSLFAPSIPQGSSPQLEARKHLERAAFLHFPPAQYKLGHVYEFAEAPFPFDPLLSVQYYSLASQQGEVEADMALSKWFLCGSGDDSSSPGHFEKDEGLAWTFADKAARRGLPSAEFAMGYYAEVGVGGPINVENAIKWYRKAKEHGNVDAAERLEALEQSVPQALSRKEHDVITEHKLVRKRTQAQQRSQTQPPPPHPYGFPTPQQGPEPYTQQQLPPPQSQQQPQRGQIMDLARRTSVLQRPAHPGRMHSVPDASPGSSPRLRPAQPQQFPNVNRYTLTDNPGPPGRNLSPARPMSGGGPGAGRYGRGGRAVSGGVGMTTPPHNSSPGPSHSPLPSETGPEAATSAKQYKGPATFAEMGIQGVKAEDKECVIM
ncbi:hypothetical protein M378DRAFT_332549 [Amanita muscaria Koide BX008]|uniref:HCP-like protein n=1 Tax=Amanita muscaria (strain Koide BX008) TaxID=946122 RepID=A0A0C2WPX1_AMAMK|nr:hypothetical protein M378DRAFT_332549 [Amanita muscaria Koide BX008]